MAYGDDILRKYGLLPPERPAKGALGTGLDVLKAAFQAPGAITGALGGALTGGFEEDDPYKRAMAENLAAITGGAPEQATFLEKARALPGAGQVVAEAVAPEPEGWGKAAANIGGLLGDIATDPLTWVGGVGLLSKGAAAAKALRAGGAIKAIEAGALAPEVAMAAGLVREVPSAARSAVTMGRAALEVPAAYRSTALPLEEAMGMAGLAGVVGKAGLAGPLSIPVYAPEVAQGAYQAAKGAYETAQQEGVGAALPQTAEALFQTGLGTLMAKGVIDEYTYAKALRNDARLKQGKPTEDAEVAAAMQQPGPTIQQPGTPYVAGAAAAATPAPGSPAAPFGSAQAPVQIPPAAAPPPPPVSSVPSSPASEAPAQTPPSPVTAVRSEPVSTPRGQAIKVDEAPDVVLDEAAVGSIEPLPESPAPALPVSQAELGVRPGEPVEPVDNVPEPQIDDLDLPPSTPQDRVAVAVRNWVANPELVNTIMQAYQPTQFVKIGQGIETAAYDIGNGRVLKISNLRAPVGLGKGTTRLVTKPENIRRVDGTDVTTTMWIESKVTPGREVLRQRGQESLDPKTQERIKKILRNRGIAFNDFHAGNWGLDAQGRFVILDQGSWRPLELGVFQWPMDIDEAGGRAPEGPGHKLVIGPHQPRGGVIFAKEEEDWMRRRQANVGPPVERETTAPPETQPTQAELEAAGQGRLEFGELAPPGLPPKPQLKRPEFVEGATRVPEEAVGPETYTRGTKAEIPPLPEGVERGEAPDYAARMAEVKARGAQKTLAERQQAAGIPETWAAKGTPLHLVPPLTSDQKKAKERAAVARRQERLQEAVEAAGITGRSVNIAGVTGIPAGLTPEQRLAYIKDKLAKGWAVDLGTLGKYGEPGHKDLGFISPEDINYESFLKEMANDPESIRASWEWANDPRNPDYKGTREAPEQPPPVLLEVPSEAGPPPKNASVRFRELGAREFPQAQEDELFQIIRDAREAGLRGEALVKEANNVWRHRGNKAQKGVIARAVRALEEAEPLRPVAPPEASAPFEPPEKPAPLTEPTEAPLTLQRVAHMNEQEATAAFMQDKNALYDMADQLEIDTERKQRTPQGMVKWYRGPEGEARLVREVLRRARERRKSFGELFAPEDSVVRDIPEDSVVQDIEEAGTVRAGEEATKAGLFAPGGANAVKRVGDEAAFREAVTAAAHRGVPGVDLQRQDAVKLLERIRAARQLAENGKPKAADELGRVLNELEEEGVRVDKLREMLGKGAKEAARVAKGGRKGAVDPVINRANEMADAGEAAEGMVDKLRQEFPHLTQKQALGLAGKAIHRKLVRDAAERLSKPDATPLGVAGGLPVDRLRDMAIVGSDWIMRGMSSAADFAARAVREFGDWVKPHARALWEQALRLARQVRGSISWGELPGGDKQGVNVGMFGLQDLWEKIKQAGPKPEVELPQTFAEAAAARQRMGKVPGAVEAAEDHIQEQKTKQQMMGKGPPPPAAAFNDPQAVEKAVRSLLDTSAQQGPVKLKKPTKVGAPDDLARNQFRNLTTLFDNQLAGREQEALEALGKEFDRFKPMTEKQVGEDAAKILLSGDPDAIFAHFKRRGGGFTPAEDLALRQYANMLELDAVLKQRIHNQRVATGQLSQKEAIEANQRLLDAGAVKALAMIKQSADQGGTNAARVLALRRIPAGTTSDADMIFGQLNAAFKKAGIPKAERTALMHAALQQPHEFIPRLRAAINTKILDKFTEYYISGLVWGPQTRVANIASNTIFRGVRDVEHALSVGIDALVSKVTGKERERFLGEVPFMLHAYRQALPESIRMWMKTKSWEVPKWDPATIGSKHDIPIRKLYGAIGQGWGPVVKSMQALGFKNFNVGELVRIPLKGLDIDDVFFKHLSSTLEIYREAYRRAAQAGGSKDQIYQGASQWVSRFLQDGELPPQKRVYKDVWNRVTKAVLDDTFQTPLEGLLAKVRDTTVAHPLMRIIVPFITTPTNIAREALARTPMAFLPGGRTWKAWKKALYGQDSTGAAIDETAKATFGSLMAFMVAQAALSGEITGGGPTDPAKQELRKATGWQPYSVKNGDQYISFQRFEPISSVMGMAADFAEAVKMDDPSAPKLAEKLLGSIVENITSKTFLTGFEGLVTALHDPRRYAERFLKQQAVSSLVPLSGMSRALTRAADPFYRETSLGPSVIQANIPGLSQELPAQTTPTGEPRRRVGESAVERFISPVGRSPVKRDLVATVSRELDEIGYPPGRPKRFLVINGRKVYLTEDERETMRNAQQEATKLVGERLLNDPQYQQLPPNDEALEGPFDTRRTRKDVVRNVYIRARRRALAQIMPELRARLQEERR